MSRMVFVGFLAKTALTFMPTAAFSGEALSGSERPVRIIREGRLAVVIF